MLAIWNILLYSVAIKILSMLYTIKLFKEKQELTHNWNSSILNRVTTFAEVYGIWNDEEGEIVAI